MNYNQEYLDRIRPMFPHGFVTELYHEINKGRRKPIPRQTIVDALTTYRTRSIKPRNGNGKIAQDEVIRLAVDKLASKGIMVY